MVLSEPDEVEPENGASVENQGSSQWTLVLFLPGRRGEELGVSSVLDLTLQAGADDQGWENGQNASVGDSECSPAEGDQRHRCIDQYDDSENQSEGLRV
jgi:hypothetical protein